MFRNQGQQGNILGFCSRFEAKILFFLCLRCKALSLDPIKQVFFWCTGSKAYVLHVICFCAQGPRPKLGICIRPNLWSMGGDSVRGTTQEMGYPWTQVKLTIFLVPLSYLEGQLKGYKNLKKSQIFLRQPWEGVLDCTKLGPICMQYSVSPDGTVVGVVGEVRFEFDKNNFDHLKPDYVCMFYVIALDKAGIQWTQPFWRNYGDNAFCRTHSFRTAVTELW